MIFTSSVELGQLPPAIVQRNVFSPADKLLTVVVGSLALANVPLPEITDQVPVPEVGALAASVAVVPHTDWSGPASDV